MKRRYGFRNRKLFPGAALASAAAFALAAFLGAWAGQSEAATSKDEIVLFEGPEIESLDPPRGGSGFVRHFLTLIYNGILEYDENSEVVPGLAKSWKMDPGGKSWTFKFRKGVRFSNGNRFTARAAKFTIDRILDKKTKARRRSVFVKVITKVEAVDDLTLRIHTKKPFPDLPNLVAILEAGVVDPAAVKKWGKAFGQHPTGTGPFMLKEWVPGDKAVLAPNPHYWGPKPKVKRIIQKSVPEGSARVFALQRGEADIVAKIPTEEIARLSKDPGIVLNKQPVQLNISYEINNVKKPWKDIRVRRALNYAVDRDAIVKRILGGFGVPSTGVVGPGVPGRRAFKPWPYDPAKARKLLAEAGYPNGFKMQIQTPVGRYVKDKLISEAIQGYLQAVGIQASVRTFEWPRYIAHIKGDPRTGVKNMSLLGRSSPYLDYHLTRLYHSSNIKGGSSRTGYSNPEVDRLIEQARFELDARKRKALYDKVQAIIWNDVPFLWMHNQVVVTGMRKNVKGVKFQKGTEGIILREAYKE